MALRTRSFALACVICAIGATACTRPGSAEGDAEAGETEGEEVEPTPVLVSAVRRGDITASLSAASTIEAEREVTIHAESTGIVRSLAVEEGDDIKAGRQIAKIRADAQALGLDRASTSLAKAKADLDIVERLHAQTIASKEELDTARLAFQNAQLDVRDRRRDMGNTRVTAPFAGTVTQRFVSEGAFVQSGAQLVSIVDFATLVARVYVPERELDRIAVGQPALVVGKAARGRKGTGTIARIAPVVDATTGTVKVTVALPEEAVGVEGGFLPGMYAEVTLTTEHRSGVLLVEKQALIRDDDETAVFVVVDGKAKRTTVELGLVDASRAEVASGLTAGDEVVLSGQAGLKDGALVVRVDASGSPLAADGPSSEGIADRGGDKVAGGI